jgi:glycosyltransferase involved in cell wall biosynthesis
MSKPFLLFRGPVKTLSGYGAHSRDILQSLYEMNLFDIKIDSCPWGNTPMTALKRSNLFHRWIESNVITNLTHTPDLYVQVTIPSEFQSVGKFNIGITAGIETTLAPKDWIDGCNRMDLIIATSQFSKDVLINTVYNETNQQNGELVNQYKVQKPVEVLFEGVNTTIYNNRYNGIDLEIKEDFAFLFVGQWLQGDLGQDRKDVGMLIKCFVESFKGQSNQPALVLKTSSANFSLSERENFRKRINSLVFGIENPPPIYLLFGELTDEEMNELYNHPKIKTMVTLTKGEGFGRPLLEFSMTGKPIMASNWSGHKDFLPMEKTIMIGGTLNKVHESSVNQYILKDSSWFTANYNEVVDLMRMIKKDYKKLLTNSESLRNENMIYFSFDNMKNKFKHILEPIVFVPQEHKFILPESLK